MPSYVRQQLLAVRFLCQRGILLYCQEMEQSIQSRIHAYSLFCLPGDGSHEPSQTSEVRRVGIASADNQRPAAIGETDFKVPLLSIKNTRVHIFLIPVFNMERPQFC